MLEVFKQWIATICAGLFFIVIVEMILPNNEMKKYAKFVLGLIMMMIILNPIINLWIRDLMQMFMLQKLKR